MAIEFRCAGCGRLLQVGDDAVGRNAQCPECGGFTVVPAASPQKSGSPVPDALGQSPPYSAPPSSPLGSGSPFGVGGPPGGPADSQNPYQSPMYFGPMQPQGVEGSADAAGRVLGPAIGLIVAGSLGIAVQLFSVVVNVANFAGVFPHANDPMPAPVLAIAVFFSVLIIVLGAIIVVGAVKMKNLESYAYAMSAAIIAIIPCFYPCCIVGLPFGIWALVVLNDPGVKAAFRR
jgi:hypothetical protein